MARELQSRLVIMQDINQTDLETVQGGHLDRLLLCALYIILTGELGACGG